MNEKIYNYLINIGFTEIELDTIEDQNELIFEAILQDITNNIDFLKQKDFNNNEIIQIIKTNPFMLTCTTNRKEYFNKIYIQKLGYKEEEIKDMLKRYPYLYTLSPLKVEKKINNYLESTSLETVKERIKNNPIVLEEGE